MENINIGISDFINIRSGIFALGVFLTILLFRRLVEKLFPRIKGGPIWRNDIIPVLPVLLGAGLGLFPTLFPYPTEIEKFTLARVFWGMTMGWLSSRLYKAVTWRMRQAKGEVPEPISTKEEEEEEL